MTRGPYWWVRHPSDSAYALGYGIATGEAASLCIPMAVFALCLAPRVPSEERLSQQRFADDWGRGAARIPRFIRRLR